MNLAIIFFAIELFYVIRSVAYGILTIRDKNIAGGVFLFTTAALIGAAGIFGFYRL